MVATPLRSNYFNSKVKQLSSLSFHLCFPLGLPQKTEKPNRSAPYFSAISEH